MSYKYEVFEHIQLLCIDIWLHEIGGNWTTASYRGGLNPYELEAKNTHTLTLNVPSNTSHAHKVSNTDGREW